MNKQKRFALFIRVSSKGQEDGESLRVQRKLGQDYVRKSGGKVVEEYCGVESATKSLKERKLLQRILRDANDGLWDALWVLDQSRLTRSPDTLPAITSTFKLSALELHTINGHKDLESPEGELHTGIQSQSDRYFARKIAQRTMQSRLALLKDGHHAFGRHPWGRTRDKELERWKVDKKKYALIQKAYDLYVDEDLGLATVANRLRIPKSSLAKAFDSAARTEWHRTLLTPEGIQKFVHKIPSLLTPLQASEIRRRRQRNRTIRPGAKRARSLLQGIVRCWHCGGKLSRMPSQKGGTTKDYPVYRHLPSSHTKKCIWHVPADLIEDDVVHACAEIIRDNKSLTAAIASALTNTKSGLDKANSRLAAIEKELLQYHQLMKRTNAELLTLSGADAACEFLRGEMRTTSALVTDRQIEQRELKEKVGALTASRGNPKEIADRLRSIVGLKGAVAITRLTPEQKRRLVLVVVGRDKEASPNGIFVRMSREGTRRTGVWHWELRGTLAVAEGISSAFAEQASTALIRQRKQLEPVAVTRLAELTQTLSPLGLGLSTSSSSGA